VAFLDGGTTVFFRGRSLWGAKRWQDGGAAVFWWIIFRKPANCGCHSFFIFGRWQVNLHHQNTMGNCQGNNLYEDEDALMAFLFAQDGVLFEELMNDDEIGGSNADRKKFRRVFPRPDYKQSVWWLMLSKGDCKIPGTREYKLFRRRFGVGFERYRDFCEAASDWDISKNSDAIGRPSVPLELKVLGALRMVCKGCAFDAIAELSGMSEQTMHRFFHVFWEKFVIHFKDLWIKFPKTAAEAARSMEDYKKLGFPGAAGSVDCTHIWWGNCPARLANLYTGKEKVPTIAYEVTVDHTGRCLHVTQGHPGTRSDKTIVKTDEFLQAMKSHAVLWDDVTFELYKSDGTITVVKGAYLISDNGYAKWRMLQAPIKSSSSMEELRWSTRLESVRKDVECFFGRLKIRFRILRSRIMFHKQRCVDNVFVAACIMHNMLLQDDGLGDDWVEADGDDDDIRDGLEIRRVRLRLQGDHRAVPNVSEGIRHIAVEDNDDDVADIEASHYTFRSQLIEHYTYAKAHGQIVWLHSNAN
jgi:hypothetical protein